MIRFANRVPLLYQQSACAITRACWTTDWRNYGVAQPRTGLPVGPLVIMVHMASVWVPFTSESKEAIADYDEIAKEIAWRSRSAGGGWRRMCGGASAPRGNFAGAISSPFTSRKSSMPARA